MLQEFVNKYFYYIFVITLIFGILLYDLIGFDYTDEICALLLFTLFGYHFFKTTDWAINKAFLFTLLVFIFYLGYSLVINSNVKRGILTDFVIQLKPYLAVFCTYTLLPVLSDKRKAQLRLWSLFLFVFLIIIGTIELFIPFTLVLVMGHATYFAAAVIMVSFCFLYASPFTTKNKIIFLLMLAIGLVSGRSKFYGFYAFTIFVVLYLSTHLDTFKLNLKNIIIALGTIAVVLFAAREKIRFYFFYTLSGEVDRDSVARFVLYRTTPDILKDYFPFGSGFGSYGTYASGEYYSQIYTKYGMDRVWGLSQDFYSYTADTYYPSLAQFGIVGILLYMFFWLYLANKGFTFYKKTHQPKHFTFIILITGFFVIEGVADSTFTTHRGFFMMMFLGMLLADMKYTLYHQPSQTANLSEYHHENTPNK